MTMCVNKATIVANINGEKGDKCYIAAGRSEEGTRGMLFYKCHIRLATEDELKPSVTTLRTSKTVGEKVVEEQVKEYPKSRKQSVWLARPWRAWGETVWAYTTWDEGVLDPEGWSTGLIQKREEFNAENPCPNSYEYKSQDQSKGRPSWVRVLSKPVLPDGTKISPKKWIKNTH